MRSDPFGLFSSLFCSAESLLIVGKPNGAGYTGITLAMEKKPVTKTWVLKAAEWFK